MVHENFRKLLRRYLTTTYSTGIYDYIDVYGYTGQAGTYDVDRCTKFPAVSVVQYNASNLNFSEFLVSSPGTTTLNDDYLICVGNTLDNNEPDYTIGNISDDSIKYTGANNINNLNELLFVSTVVNNSNEQKTFNAVGLFYHTKHTSTTYKWNGSMYATYLCIKEVLSTPIVIPPNSSITITMNIFGEVAVSS